MKDAKHWEDIWHEANIHKQPNTHDSNLFRPEAMNPNEIKRAIDAVGPIEEPYLGR
jgi:hypothetical protein